VAGLQEGGIALQRGQVIPVSSHAYEAIGPDGEQCASFHPQLRRHRRVEVPDGVWVVGAGRERYGGFEQGRMFYVFLQSGVKSR
jgi:hypothetical protein